MPKEQSAAREEKQLPPLPGQRSLHMDTLIKHSLPVHVGLCSCAAGDEQQEFVSCDSVFPPASSRWASLTSQCATSSCGDNSVCVCFTQLFNVL